MRYLRSVEYTRYGQIDHPSNGPNHGQGHWHNRRPNEWQSQVGCILLLLYYITL